MYLPTLHPEEFWCQSYFLFVSFFFRCHFVIKWTTVYWTQCVSAWNPHYAPKARSSFAKETRWTKCFSWFAGNWRAWPTTEHNRGYSIMSCWGSETFVVTSFLLGLLTQSLKITSPFQRTRWRHLKKWKLSRCRQMTSNLLPASSGNSTAGNCNIRSGGYPKLLHTHIQNFLLYFWV